MTYAMIIAIIVLIHVALSVWAALKVLSANGSALSKAIWILLITVFPLVGLIIWLLAGPTDSQRSA